METKLLSYMETRLVASLGLDLFDLELGQSNDD